MYKNKLPPPLATSASPLQPPTMINDPAVANIGTNILQTTFLPVGMNPDLHPPKVFVASEPGAGKPTDTERGDCKSLANFAHRLNPRTSRVFINHSAEAHICLAPPRGVRARGETPRVTA